MSGFGRPGVMFLHSVRAGVLARTQNLPPSQDRALMQQITQPRIPVVLSEMELHWLITWHDLNIHEPSATSASAGRDWSLGRREDLLSAWDRTPERRGGLPAPIGRFGLTRIHP